MSTITAILVPEADGTIRLLLPEELRGGQVRVTATIEATDEAPQPRFGYLAGKIQMAPDFDAPMDDFKAYME